MKRSIIILISSLILLAFVSCDSEPVESTPSAPPHEHTLESTVISQSTFLPGMVVTYCSVEGCDYTLVTRQKESSSTVSSVSKEKSLKMPQVSADSFVSALFTCLDAYDFDFGSLLEIMGSLGETEILGEVAVTNINANEFNDVSFSVFGLSLVPTTLKASWEMKDFSFDSEKRLLKGEFIESSDGDKTIKFEIDVLGDEIKVLKEGDEDVLDYSMYYLYSDVIKEILSYEGTQYTISEKSGATDHTLIRFNVKDGGTRKTVASVSSESSISITFEEDDDKEFITVCTEENERFEVTFSSFRLIFNGFHASCYLDIYSGIDIEASIGGSIELLSNDKKLSCQISFCSSNDEDKKGFVSVHDLGGKNEIFADVRILAMLKVKSDDTHAQWVTLEVVSEKDIFKTSESKITSVDFGYCNGVPGTDKTTSYEWDSVVLALVKSYFDYTCSDHNYY